MSSLILNAGTASPIVVNCSRLGKNSPRYVGGRTDSNQGTERNTIRGQKKAIPVAVAPVDTATEASIQAAAYNGAQIPCSGDILGNIQTLCSLDVASEMVPGLPGFFTMTLTIYEVNASVTLARYAPGDTVTGENFTRATSARYADANGIYQLAAINAKRDGHYVGGIRSLLLEDTRTNAVLWSRDLTNAAWTKTGTGTVLLNTVGLDGTANSASTLSDTDAAAIYTVAQSVTIVNNSATHCVRFWVLKDTNQVRFPGFRLQLSGGTAVTRTVDLNTQTGALTTTGISGVGTSKVISDGLWWIVEISCTNNTTGNATLNAAAFPGLQTSFGTDSAAAQGAIIVGQAQIELNAAFGSSPIFTTTVAVGRSADVYSLPFTAPPGEMSCYVKFVELGTINTAGSRLFSVEAFDDSSPRFLVASGYSAVHANSGGTATSLLGAAPGYGDQNELDARLFADGSVDITQSVNSAATTSATQTAANPFTASAWSGQTVWLNSAGSVGNFGFVAIRSFKIIAGARSMTELRAA